MEKGRLTFFFFFFLLFFLFFLYLGVDFQNCKCSLASCIKKKKPKLKNVKVSPDGEPSKLNEKECDRLKRLGIQDTRSKAYNIGKQNKDFLKKKNIFNQKN